MTFRARVLARLIRFEGKKPHLYYLNGIPHIGVGHNLSAKDISEAAMAQIVRDDLADVERDLLRELPWVAGLASPRRAVFYDLAFNMGIGGLLEFHRMLEAAQAGTWERAAAELLNSGYAVQLPERAEANAHQLRDARWA